MVSVALSGTDVPGPASKNTMKLEMDSCSLHRVAVTKAQIGANSGVFPNVALGSSW